jgi:hypothetical protein
MNGFVDLGCSLRVAGEAGPSHFGPGLEFLLQLFELGMIGGVIGRVHLPEFLAGRWSFLLHSGGRPGRKTAEQEHRHQRNGYKDTTFSHRLPTFLFQGI